MNRASANAILRDEAALLSSLRHNLQRATNTLNVTATASETLGGLALLGGVRMASQRMLTDVTSSVANGRQRAAGTATRRIGAELDMVAQRIGADITASAASDRFIDRSQSVAYSFTRAWSSAVVGKIAERASVAEVVRASRTQDFRLRRIAATENAQAYSAAHRDASVSVASRYAGAQWLRGVYRRWEALLDAYVCKVCKSMDGQIAPLGVSFSQNREPGEVHPCCRCFSTLVGMPAFLPTDSGDGLVVKRRAATSSARAPAPQDNSPWGGGGEWGGGGSSGSY